MSATATKSDLGKQILGKLDDLDRRLSAHEKAIESLGKADPRAGIASDELIAKMARQADRYGGAISFTPEGQVIPTKPYDPLGKRIGKCMNSDNGHVATFGQWCSALDAFMQGMNKGGWGTVPGGAVEELNKMGMCQYRHDDANNTITKTALAESSGVAGGYGVPPMFLQELLRLTVEESIIRPRARKLPMTSLTLTVPSLDITTAPTAGNTALVGGVAVSWPAESTTFAESEPQLRQSELKAWMAAFYTVASRTLLADQAVGLDALLTQLFSQAMAWTWDYVFIQGNGVGKPLGILNCPATIAVTRNVAGHFRFQDVGQMLSKIYWLNRESMVWIMHQSVIPDLYTLNDMAGSSTGTGRVLFMPMDQGIQAPIPGKGPQAFGQLAGYDVMISEKVPALGTAGCVLLVNCAQYLIGERQDIEVEMSPHVNFTKNQMTWRVLQRGDGTAWMNSAITLADTVYQASFAASLTQ